MHFFEKQKIDQAGIVGVSLQKVLIFLMIVNVLGVFAGGFLSSILGFLLLLVGFLGAYRRRTCFLMAYFSISVAIIAIAAVAAVIVLLGVFAVSNPSYGNESSSSDYSGSSSDNYYARALLQLQPTPSSSSSYDSPSSSSSSSSASSSADVDFRMLAILGVLALVFYFVLAFYKIYSLVLAWRMRKMLVALNAQAGCSQTTQNCDHSSVAVSVNSLVEANNSPMMMAPGYVMNPYAFQQMPGQYYMQGAMYNGQPVMYTFAPPPQLTSETDDAPVKQV